MRFTILRPPLTNPAGDSPPPDYQPTCDPRFLECSSLDDLRRKVPPVGDYPTEALAAVQARMAFPDSIAMIVPLKIGSGTVPMMGILAEWAGRERVDPDKPMPFVMLVVPTSESDTERARMKKGDMPFTEETWKLKPVRPIVIPTPATAEGIVQSMTGHAVEVRATDLRAPVYVNAIVGHAIGSDRLTIFVEIGDIQMSMTFTDPRVSFNPPG